jgi:methyl-accepting chemotaxis protein
LIATLISISGFSFYAMREEGEIANSIVVDRVLPMEQLKRIGDGYAVDIVDTAHKVRAGAISPQDRLGHVDRALASIEARWKEYISTKAYG